MTPCQGFARGDALEPPRFDGFVRVSLHVAARDGVRLAVDVFLPAASGVASAGPVPTLFQMTPYNRAQIVDGMLSHVLSPYPGAGPQDENVLLSFVRHGYAVVAADVRGQGASFGRYAGPLTVEEGRDGADLIAWIRRQPWSDGKIGMFGSSYGGSTQLLVAAERPAGLEALFVMHSAFDCWDVFFPGGARNVALPQHWGALVNRLGGRGSETVAAPVDGPDGPVLLAAAVAEHGVAADVTRAFDMMYGPGTRDGSPYFLDASSSGPRNLSTLLPRLRTGAPPTYFHGGWNDYFPGALARWFNNWPGPARLTLGPWTHSPLTFSSPRDTEDLRVRRKEGIRWFDHWLRGRPTGVMSESRVVFAAQHGHRFRHGAFDPSAGDDRWDWYGTDRFPPPDVEDRRFHLAPGPSGGIGSPNDGVLAEEAPLAPFVHEMEIDPGVGTGPHNRMGASFHFVPQRFPEMSEVDVRCLTWTSRPLSAPLFVVGVPELRLSVSADAPRVTLVAWLEEVDETGRSTVITYGSLDSAHRAVAPPPYDTAGVIWHPSTTDAVAAAPPLTDGSAAVRMSLEPVANVFRVGARIRLTLAGADDGNLQEQAAGARLRVDGGGIESGLLLPVSDLALAD